MLKLPKRQLRMAVSSYKTQKSLLGSKEEVKRVDGQPNDGGRLVAMSQSSPRLPCSSLTSAATVASHCDVHQPFREVEDLSGALGLQVL